MLAAVTAAAIGCSRPFYRRQADADAYCLTDQKAAVAGSNPQEFRIDIDPRSRMYDSYNPDVEPMPPDDPAAHRYLLCVDSKTGSKCWKCLPKTPFVDNPNWLRHLPRNDRDEVQLDLRDAAEVALLNSPTYQSELETLYLSALDVSFERFRFDTQFFGGSDVFLTADARDRSGTGKSSSVFEISPSRPANRFRSQRLTATGGELVVGMANSLVWQFAGPDDYSSNTVLDFSLVQPLLRAGGRTQVLERLTIAERSLLYNVRSMERYRRGFYLDVAIGRNPGGGPSRRGGFFGGSGLEGFTGVGGGFGSVGNVSFGSGLTTGGGITGGAGAAGAGGYIGLLQAAQIIRNQRSNVFDLRDSFEQLQAANEAGRIDRFQVDLARQALYNAQSQLLTAEAAYRTTLDNFKLDLGLPPELEVKVADPLLDRFNLLDPRLDDVQAAVNRTLASLRNLRSRLQDPAAPVNPNDPEFVARLAQLIEEGRQLESASQERVAAVQADLGALDAALPQRRKYLEQLAAREEVQTTRIDPSLFSVTELDARAAKHHEDFESLKTQMNPIWQRLEQIQQASGDPPEARLSAMIAAVSDLSSRLLELSLVQAAARLEAISFEPVELTDEEALLIASAYRRDWQNARASLVDSWRLIYFNANALLSDLDFIFSGDVGNVGDNPLNLRTSRGRLRVGMQWDPPLTRLSERNLYRQSLIEYQQARRGYYQFRDRVSQVLRQNLRQTRLNELNFELRRAAVLVAISQVDLTQLRLSQPPQPTAPGAAPQAQFSVTTARDLVQALSDLLNVQNDFLSVWVNHEIQRLNLDYDLGIMELDEAGLRKEHDVPLSAYIAGAQAIRAKLCNATDLYPNLYDSNKGAAKGGEGEQIRPMLEYPESIGPGKTEALPIPLETPAARVEPDITFVGGPGVSTDGAVISAALNQPVSVQPIASSAEQLPLALPPVRDK
jgi:hypothetical protein